MAEPAGYLNVRPMNSKRILVANELKSYGEAVSLALRVLCPAADVFEVEQRYLSREVRQIRPDLVVCSRATDVVRTQVGNWVELYPDCGALCEVCVDGVCSTVDNLELMDLVEIVRGPEHASISG